MGGVGGVGVCRKTELGLSFSILGFLCSWLCTGYAMRGSQWANSSIACRIIQNICEQSWGPGQAPSLPQWRQSTAWGTWPPGFLGRSMEQPLLEDGRLCGPTIYLGILNHQAAYSLLPPPLTRNGVALSLSRCGAFSLSSGRGILQPQCCLLFWVCVLGRG